MVSCDVSICGRFLLWITLIFLASAAGRISASLLRDDLSVTPCAETRTALRKSMVSLWGKLSLSFCLFDCCSDSVSAGVRSFMLTSNSVVGRIKEKVSLSLRYCQSSLLDGE